MASVTFAVLLAVTMKSLQKGVFDNLIKNLVSFYSGYIQIHKNGYSDEQILDNSFEYSDLLISEVDMTNGVSNSVARIESFALASSGNTSHGCMVVGTQPEKENLMTSLRSRVIKGDYLTDSDESVILAEGLAKKLSIGVNDTLVLLGQGFHGSSAAAKFPVKGIVHFGSPQLNELLVFLSLKTGQEFLSAENRITTIAIKIENPLTLIGTDEEIEKKLGENFEVLNWKQMMPDIDTHVRADNKNFYIFIGVLYCLIAFGIFGTVLMMLSERKYEIGMLMAIGMRKIQISLMLAGEILFITFLGTICGIIISIPIVRYFELHPIRFRGTMAKAYENFGFEALWPAVLDKNIFVTQAIIVTAIAIIIGIFPIVKVRRMNAITSMKR